jgi:hypothetical protein
MEVSCLALVVLCLVKVEGSGAGVCRVDPETPTDWDTLGTISGRSDEVVSIEIVNFAASVLVTLFVVVEFARIDFSWVDLAGALDILLKVLEASVAVSGPCSNIWCMDRRLGVQLFVLEFLLLAASDDFTCCSLFEKDPTCDLLIVESASVNGCAGAMPGWITDCGGNNDRCSSCGFCCCCCCC